MGALLGRMIMMTTERLFVLGWHPATHRGNLGTVHIGLDYLIREAAPPSADAYELESRSSSGISCGRVWNGVLRAQGFRLLINPARSCISGR